MERKENLLLVKSKCHQHDGQFFIDYATTSRLVSYAGLFTTNDSLQDFNYGEQRNKSITNFLLSKSCHF